MALASYPVVLDRGGLSYTPIGVGSAFRAGLHG